MASEITEEQDEDAYYIMSTEAQRSRIRRIVEYQQSLYLSSSLSSFSSAGASCSSLSSSQRSSSLLELMKGGSTSLRRLFDMEHTSLATHFNDYSGSPVTKPIPLWGSDSGAGIQDDPWKFMKQIGPVIDSGRNSQRGPASEGSFMDVDCDIQSRKTRIRKHKLNRTKSFRKLPGFSLWRCRRFRFRLGFRWLRIKFYDRKLRASNSDTNNTSVI